MDKSKRPPHGRQREDHGLFRKIPDRPPTREGAVNRTMQAWEKFLSGDGMLPDAVRRMIGESWRRCLDHGVSPVRHAAPLAVDDNGLHSLRERHVDLIEAARPVMIQAHEFLAESGTVMVLTDPAGVILSMEGDPGAKDDGLGIQLVPGALWTELESGTNAIGTALATGQPVQISAEEHFCEGIKRWTCSATVIRDPYNGQILGVLDISGLSGSHNTHCLALAVTGAGRIEARLTALEMEKRSRLLDLTMNQTQRRKNRGMMIFDRRGRLVRADESAGLFLNGMGLDLGSCQSIGIIGEPNESAVRPDKLPGWLNREWLEPIIDHAERLGTVLVIPESGHGHGSGGSLPEPEGGQADGPFSRIIGCSPALKLARSRARQLARLHVPVLLLGPTGAGKEVFARALHDAGPNASGPFVPLNCGAMTRDLLASELFGYVDGAFTGARRGGMAGKFEAADGGTLFLDEIGEMPLELQPHLLRVLEESEVCRLGETRPRKIRVRLLAATNRDLRAEVARGNFRMDLYYRLAVTLLRLPELAEHKEDIPLLVRYFSEETARRHGVTAKYPDDAVLDAMLRYRWPGNVRELRNVVEGMVLLAEGHGLTCDDLPPELCGPHTETSPGGGGPEMLEPESAVTLTNGARAMIVAAIRTENGNFTRAASRLGIAKSTLYEKMKRYGIDRHSARSAQTARPQS
jgi:transcriptional regulator of acetoin/glycerol metabolism